MRRPSARARLRLRNQNHSPKQITNRGIVEKNVKIVNSKLLIDVLIIYKITSKQMGDSKPRIKNNVFLYVIFFFSSMEKPPFHHNETNKQYAKNTNDLIHGHTEQNNWIFAEKLHNKAEYKITEKIELE